MELVKENVKYDDFIDAVEAEMHNIGLDEFEVSDFFCEGLYIRTVYVPAGSYITSKIHKTKHPYILSQGHITIFTENGGEEQLVAPYMGITEAGTRRFARAESNCLFTTIHRTDKTTPEEVEEEVIEQRINPLLINKNINNELD